jgi:hypothetical protein
MANFLACVSSSPQPMEKLKKGGDQREGRREMGASYSRRYKKKHGVHKVLYAQCGNKIAKNHRKFV